MSLRAGDSVQIKGEAVLFEITDDYRKGCDIIQKCSAGCSIDHDHYEEAYVIVTSKTRRAVPMSSIDKVFDKNTHIGKKFIPLL